MMRLLPWNGNLLTHNNSFFYYYLFIFLLTVSQENTFFGISAIFVLYFKILLYLYETHKNKLCINIIIGFLICYK